MKWFLLITVVLFSSEAFSQVTAKRYAIHFTDKAGIPYTLDQPLEFLSQRALDRRARQGIGLDSSDLPVNQDYIQAVLDQGSLYLTESKWFNSVTVAVPNDDIRDSILNLPFVVSSFPVGKYGETPKVEDKFALIATEKSQIPEPLEETDYGLAFNQIDMIGGISLHNQGYRGEGMLIALMDGGFSNVNNHPAYERLRNEGRLLGGWDFVQQDATVFENSSHGQSVLATMAAYLPGEFIGTAPEASYLLCRTEDTGSEFPVELDYWIAGAEFADSAGADIINSSLGYTTFDGVSFNFTYDDMDGNTTRGSIGADKAASKGILVVNSAGNSGAGSWQYIGAPADGDSVLAIGAVSAEGFRANFSSQGPSSDGDVKPNVCAQGFAAAIVNSGGDISVGNGTSFSGPIIAGMAACLWQANLDSATNMDVFRAIEQSAHQYNDPDGLYGYGIPNFAKANLILQGIEVDDEEQSQLLPVYPSPFYDQFQGVFYSAYDQKYTVRLVNNLGQVVRQQEGNAPMESGIKFRFGGLQDLNEGMYVLQIDADSGKYYQKLVKLRQ